MIKTVVIILGTLPFFAALSAHAQQVAAPKSERKPAPANKLVGGVEVVSSREARHMALPQGKYRAVHFVNSKEFFLKYQDRSKIPSGLYLLDTKLIPRRLPEILARNNVTLGAGGSIVNKKGEKVYLIVGYKLFAVKKKQGMLGRRFFGLLGSTPAKAASPYDLAYISLDWSWQDNEGFCRAIIAVSNVAAWGLDAGGNPAPTNIETITVDTYAGNNSSGDQQCSNCPSQEAQAYDNFGCGWPAHEGGAWGWAVAFDGWLVQWATSWP
jgi:hypothetical protein